MPKAKKLYLPAKNLGMHFINDPDFQHPFFKDLVEWEADVFETEAFVKGEKTASTC